MNIQLHRLPVPSQDIWVWHVAEGEAMHELGNSDVALLEAEGWQLLDPDGVTFPFLALISQLADTLPVLLTDARKIKMLAKDEAIAFAKHHPVILAFAHQVAEQPPLFPGPPAQLGELGLVFVDDQMYYPYEIALLGEKGTSLCQRLRTALGTFLSTSFPLEERERAWRDAQECARTLAHLYWEVHQRTPLAEPTDTRLAVQATESPATGARRLRSSRQWPPLAIVQSETPAVTIPVDPITQELMRSLLDGSSYQLYEEELIAEHVSPLAMRIRIQPGNGEEWDAVLRSLKMLGDEVVDTFCAVLAIAIETNGPTNMTAPFFLDVDDILRVCGRRPSNRAFTPLQRLSTVERLRALSRVHIFTAGVAGDGALVQPVAGKAKRRGRGSDQETFKAFDSTVLDLLGTTIGEYYALTGETLWERREMKIGRWAQLAPSLSQQTALLLRKVLGYHAQRQRHEKRIGRWLTLQFQVHSGHTAGAVVCTTQTLLEQSGIKPNLNKPGEVRSSVEDAVRQLAEDKVIGMYRKMIVLDKQPVKALLQRVNGVMAGESTQDKYDIDAFTSEEHTVRQQIQERAWGWWPLYKTHVWWFFRPPGPPDQALLL